MKNILKNVFPREITFCEVERFHEC